MRFTIVREEFLKGLSIAARAVGSKAANPILENLKIELDDRGLFITGSNFDLTIKTLIPYVSNDKEIIRNYKEGATLIKTKFIVDIVRKMESEEITLEKNKDEIMGFLSQVAEMPNIKMVITSRKLLSQTQ